MADTDDLSTPPRAGTYADLSRRMDRMENRHEDLAAEVRAISTDIAGIKLQSEHAEKLNELRFNALDKGQHSVETKLDTFIRRIEGIIDGTVETAQSKQAAQMVADYFEWRKATDLELNRLSDFHEEDDARSQERARIANITNRTLATVVVVANFLLGAIVVIVNLANP